MTLKCISTFSPTYMYSAKSDKKNLFFFASKQYHIVTHLVWVHDKRIDT